MPQEINNRSMVAVVADREIRVVAVRFPADDDLVAVRVEDGRFVARVESVANGCRVLAQVYPLKRSSSSHDPTAPVARTGKIAGEGIIVKTA